MALTKSLLPREQPYTLLPTQIAKEVSATLNEHALNELVYVAEPIGFSTNSLISVWEHVGDRKHCLGYL